VYLYKAVGEEGLLLLAVALRGRFVACDVYGLQLPAPGGNNRNNYWGKLMVRECGRVRHQLHLGTSTIKPLQQGHAHPIALRSFL